MNSFPGRLLTSERRHGGLGMISITNAALARKRKVLLELVNRSDASGIATQCLVVNALRASGQGGAGQPSTQMWNSLGSGDALNALIGSLKSIGLRIRAGNATREREDSAVDGEGEVLNRGELNRRGMVYTNELCEGSLIQLRTGQCWQVGNRLLEVLAYRGDSIEYIEWEATAQNAQRGPGSIVHISPRNEYQGYPTGMGGRNAIMRSEFIREATHLVEMGIDWSEKLGGSQVTLSRIMQLRRGSIVDSKPIEEVISREWAEWGGGDFSHIYTDGSHAADRTLAQFLLGTKNQKVGGAVILSDGHCAD